MGNIDFIGDVVIKGMVNDGFKVKSGKSITVMGNVYAATLEARQNIIIKQGAINSQLEAGGDVRVGFAKMRISKRKKRYVSPLQAVVFSAAVIYRLWEAALSSLGNIHGIKRRYRKLHRK